MTYMIKQFIRKVVNFSELIAGVTKDKKFQVTLCEQTLWDENSFWEIGNTKNMMFGHDNYSENQLIDNTLPGYMVC